jgi:Na+/H+ antiporter NhaD/arsenite permease-like protein
MAILVTGATCLFSSRLPFSEVVLQKTGALLCWFLAGYLFYRSLQRQRRRRRQQQQQQQQQQTFDPNEEMPLVTPPSSHVSAIDDDVSQPWMVVTLTFVGSLDEIMYFPGLLLGHLFTAWELCLGACLAGCIMLLVVLTCLRHSQPLMNFLDRIPLYVVVAVFAVVITVQSIQEWGLKCHSSDRALTRETKTN